jgi:hypothetical protein
MKKQRFSQEQIIAAVNQMEGGCSAADIARELGVNILALASAAAAEYHGGTLESDEGQA